MNVLLEPLSRSNIGLLVAAGAESSSPSYDLPVDAEGANRRLEQVEFNREYNLATEFLAYNTESPAEVVGGGQIIGRPGYCTLAYWVVKALRGCGHGVAIGQALETEAIELYPDTKAFRIVVGKQNEASCRLAKALGYQRGEVKESDIVVVYRKLLGANALAVS